VPDDKSKRLAAGCTRQIAAEQTKVVFSLMMTSPSDARRRVALLR
jgi:hypothetical protein